MFPWLWVWAPQFNYPWSGDVAQRIEPITHLFFKGIQPGAGDASIEEKSFELATYGKQLGWITEALIGLAEQTPALTATSQTSLDKLKHLQQQIDGIKRAEHSASADAIEAQLLVLQRRGGEGYEQVVNRLRPLLHPPQAKALPKPRPARR